MINSFWAIIDFLQAYNGAVTAVATVFIASFTIVLAVVTNRQARLTKEALVTTQRAFVFMEDIEALFSTKWGTDANPSALNFVMAPRWRNSGDTPSRNLTIRVNWQPFDGELPKDFDFPFTDEPIKTLIGPDANEWSKHIRISDSDVSKATDGALQIYIWGRADYEDIFRNTPQHFTQFCYRLRFHRFGREVKVQFVPYSDYNKSDYDKT
jgi:hypothetical protein